MKKLRSGLVRRAKEAWDICIPKSGLPYVADVEAVDDSELVVLAHMFSARSIAEAGRPDGIAFAAKLSRAELFADALRDWAWVLYLETAP
ncbi:MAG: hypothetical protein COA38_20415 [Fluviicola sp.]|nr:MAG: hypothetical protein COA38_20415 [Fluviicola sp.]